MGGHPHQQTSTSQAGGDRLESDRCLVQVAEWLIAGRLSCGSQWLGEPSKNQSQREAMPLDCCKGLYVCILLYKRQQDNSKAYEQT